MNLEMRKTIVDENTTVSSEWVIPDAYDRNVALLLAHGAGNNMHSPFISYIQRSMGENGCLCVKFNFPYTEQGPARTGSCTSSYANLARCYCTDRCRPAAVAAQSDLVGKEPGRAHGLDGRG